MLVERMQRAAMLDNNLYNEVERDEQATSQAFQVVLIAAVATGLGTFIGSILSGRGGAGVGGLVAGVLSALLAWVVWSYVTYFIGTRVFGGTGTPGELLRTLGFANSPQVLNILGFVPLLGGLIRFVVLIWVLIAGIVAVREALDFDTGKTIGTVILGWLAMLVIVMVEVAILGLLGLTFG